MSINVCRKKQIDELEIVHWINDDNTDISSWSVAKDTSSFTSWTLDGDTLALPHVFAIDRTSLLRQSRFEEIIFLRNRCFRLSMFN